MTERTDTKGVKWIILGVVLVALIVVLAIVLSSCGNEDAAVEPTAEPTAAIEEKTDIAPDPASASGGSTGGSSSGSGSITADTKPGTPAPERDKVEYIRNYGDNVENGVQAAADQFVDELKKIGDGYNTGDVDKIGSTVKDFTGGLGDFLGGVKDSVIP